MKSEPCPACRPEPNCPVTGANTPPTPLQKTTPSHIWHQGASQWPLQMYEHTPASSLSFFLSEYVMMSQGADVFSALEI